MYPHRQSILIYWHVVYRHIEGKHQPNRRYNEDMWIEPGDILPSVTTCIHDKKGNVCICTTRQPGYCNRTYYIGLYRRKCNWGYITEHNTEAVASFTC